MELDGNLLGLALQTENERICRELGNKDRLGISLGNQASLLAHNLGPPREALALAEKAYRLAAGAGLTALAQQIQPNLEDIRSKVQCPGSQPEPIVWQRFVRIGGNNGRHQQVP